MPNLTIETQYRKSIDNLIELNNIWVKLPKRWRICPIHFFCNIAEQWGFLLNIYSG